MKNLILALNSANLTDSVMESVLTEIDIWLDSKINRSEQKMTSQFIVPIQKENDNNRSELRILTETVKNGFEKMDQKWEERFLRSDEKLEFFRKSLEAQISATRENLELQINANRESLEKQINSNREHSDLQTSRLERQIAYTRENLETQIKSNDKQLGLIQKLLWLLLTLVLGMFAKVFHLI